MNIENIIQEINFSNMAWQIATPLLFSLFDVITGYIQAIINNNVDSQKMREGLWHKVLIIIILLMSYIIDFTFSLKFVGSTVSIYIILMELVSILENVKKAGIDIGKIGNILKDKSDKTTAENIETLINKIDDISRG